MNEDYLWDKSGRPDPEIERLEHALQGARWEGGLPEVELPARTKGVSTVTRIAWLAAAAALALALAPLLVSRSSRSAPSIQYAYEALAGSPAVQGAKGGRTLSAGDLLVCGANDRARIEVSDIGSLEVGPDSRLEIRRPEDGAPDAQHLFYLERGSVSASIFAAPRIFQVGTPAGIAVDMGCIYTTRVDDNGDTRLAVDSGFVSFETPERRVLVPAGASSLARPGRRLGTPVWDDAPPAWRAAVERLDDDGPSEPLLDRILETERQDDSLTLWHLLDHPDRSVRTRVFDRLAALVPVPPGVTREGCLKGELEVLERWRAELDWSW